MTTIEEVEGLRKEILDHQECDYDLMRDFTIKLHELLVSEGYHSEYSLPKWFPGLFGDAGYTSGIDIRLGRQRAHLTIHPLFRSLMLLNSLTCPMDVQALLHELNELKYGCPGCLYSDDTTSYCGLGRDMVPGCKQYVPWKGVT